MQANKYDFPSQTPGQLFIHSLNFLMLRQLLGKWEGRGKRNVIQEHKRRPLVPPHQSLQWDPCIKMLLVIMCEVNSGALCVGPDESHGEKKKALV